MSSLLQPQIFNPFKKVKAAQSTRLGGVSPVPFASLNLGKSTADLPENVAENRRRFCSELGFEPEKLAMVGQVHGSEVLFAREPGLTVGFDAVMTDQTGILVAVSVADCTPILIFDSKNGAVAAVHAGWRGTVAGIVLKTLERMRDEFGSRATDCFTFVGACISEKNFEVGEEVAVHFSDEHRHWDSTRGKFFVNLKSANRAQLLDFGLPPEQIEVSDFCTVERNDLFFSHRKERGTTGRMLAAIGLLA